MMATFNNDRKARQGDAVNDFGSRIRKNSDACSQGSEVLRLQLRGNNDGKTRRGVLLLVVLGLLAMFGMVGIAFVLLTSQARRGADALRHVEEYADPAPELLHQAFLQVVRGPGPNNDDSAIGPHSLLEDMYGDDATNFTITTVSALSGCAQIVEINCGLSNATQYVGRVLTMTSGPAAGLSTRIVATRTNRLQVLAFEGDDPEATDTFIINGIPFSGTGFGFSTTNDMCDAEDSNSRLTALQPGIDSGSVTGDANEDYDAVDFQNMLLAAQIVDASGDLVATIPSLHRPALVNYWITSSGGGSWANLVSTTPALARNICLRPSTQDHPNFTGSNPTTFNPAWDGTGTANEWDVDNDGDGVMDSVWVDLGMPVRSAANGMLYKPLFAILCTDLDGRLNLNAHGCYAQTDANYYGNVAAGGNYQFADGTSSATIPRGQGYGPAEINLRPLLGTNYQTILNARYYSASDGLSVPGKANNGATLLGNDPLSFNQHFDYPDNYTTGISSYGSPPDFKGSLAVGLDLRGQPLWKILNDQWANAAADDPYELNLSRHNRTSADSPFTPAELERLLRPRDADCLTLPSRLATLATVGSPPESVLVARRHEITTESWDLPCPGGGVIKGIQTQQLTALLSTLPANLVSELLPLELLCGLRMDINRPFGNGVDENGNGVVDDPSEVSSETISAVNKAGATVPGITFNHTNGLDVDGNGTVNATDRQLARQLYARHLFVLMMLLRDDGYVEVPGTPAEDPTLTATQKRELMIRRIAQWAINVVDFRDADSIMTPFEYDENPLDGWSVDGDLTTDESAGGVPRGVVWGCERPELLLTETLAFHDRRVVDTAFDDGLNKLRTDDSDTDDTAIGPADDDLDQARIPQGSAFFELYCTGNQANGMAPGDLYTYNSGKWYLDLGKMAPANPSASDAKLKLAYPVWRLVISEHNHPANLTNPNATDVLNRLNKRPYSTSLEPEQFSGSTSSGEFSLLRSSSEPSVTIDRIVWFSTQGPNGHYDEGRIYYNRSGAAGLLGGTYALVGPRLTTAIGAKSGSAQVGDPSAQTITLNPVGTTDTSGTDNYPAMVGEGSPTIQIPTGIVVGGGGDGTSYPTSWSNKTVTAPQGIGISISEPLFSGSYYTEPDEVNPKNSLTEAYGDLTKANAAKLFLDAPLDSKANTPLEDEGLLPTGTTPNYKTVFLQRLADPTSSYDPVKNPYRTVDWMPIDLTVFNGEDSQPAQWPPVNETWPDKWDEDDPNPATPHFKTRYRANTTNNIWAQETQAPTTASAAASSSNYFDYKLEHTLGYLNTAFGTPRSTPTPYIGDPPSPFPWMTWNNRPYVSQLELMQVSTSHPGRLLWEYGMASTGSAPYAPTDPADVPFPHLLNFFQSDATTSTGTSPQFHRVLEYLRVPSRFAGTALQGNPTRFAAATNHIFHPPFHWISRYRDPGRVNINTVFSPSVWQGLMNYFPTTNTTVAAWKWSNFVTSRRGYGGVSSDMTLMDNSRPTRFAKPFRSALGANLVPLDPMKPTREINATLLREGPTAGKPLFGLEAAVDPTDNYCNTNRNPYFRYEGLQRLGNLVTTRSNVYAIWITVGYFQVDGSGLLQNELGTDTGEINRHRAFYIFDRSIPVGFTQGEDHNVEDAILVKRFIE